MMEEVCQGEAAADVQLLTENFQELSAIGRETISGSAKVFLPSLMLVFTDEDKAVTKSFSSGTSFVFDALCWF